MSQTNRETLQDYKKWWACVQVASRRHPLAVCSSLLAFGTGITWLFWGLLASQPTPPQLLLCLVSGLAFLGITRGLLIGLKTTVFPPRVLPVAEPVSVLPAEDGVVQGPSQSAAADGEPGPAWHAYLAKRSIAILFSAIGCGALCHFAIITVFLGLNCQGMFFECFQHLNFLGLAVYLAAVALGSTLVFLSHLVRVLSDRQIKPRAVVPCPSAPIGRFTVDEPGLSNHPESIKVKAKRRARYLQRKAGLRIATFVAGAFTVIFGLGALSGWIDNDDHMALPDVFLCGCLWSLSKRAFGYSVRKSKALPYVPPVRDQVAALPPVEVLLRGAMQPAAASGELLRAANKATVTASEELLRPGETATL